MITLSYSLPSGGHLFYWQQEVHKGQMHKAMCISAAGNKANWEESFQQTQEDLRDSPVCSSASPICPFQGLISVFSFVVESYSLFLSYFSLVKITRKILSGIIYFSHLAPLHEEHCAVSITKGSYRRLSKLNRDENKKIQESNVGQWKVHISPPPSFLRVSHNLWSSWVCGTRVKEDNAA